MEVGRRLSNPAQSQSQSLQTGEYLHPPTSFTRIHRQPSQFNVSTNQSRNVLNMVMDSPLSPDTGCPSQLGSLVLRLSKSIAIAVEVLTAVGETIGDHIQAEVKLQMMQSCGEARHVCSELEKLSLSWSHGVVPSTSCSEPTPTTTDMDNPPPSPTPITPPSLQSAVNCEQIHLQKSHYAYYPSHPEVIDKLIRTLHYLLTSVTKILLLTDNILVKQLLKESNFVLDDHSKTAAMSRFTEFVKAFCDFGVDMVHLEQVIIGDRDNLSRCARRQAQVEVARSVLDRAIKVLMTACKTFDRHSDCLSARENRDTVFCQIRRAVDLVHFVIKEGLTDCLVKSGVDAVDPISNEEDEENDKVFMDSTPVIKSVKYFQDNVEIMRMSSAVSDGYKEQLITCLDTIVERTQDFTDSAYTSHSRRQNILLHCDRAKVELTHLLRLMDERNVLHTKQKIKLIRA